MVSKFGVVNVIILCYERIICMNLSAQQAVCNELVNVIVFGFLWLLLCCCYCCEGGDMLISFVVLMVIFVLLLCCRDMLVVERIVINLPFRPSLCAFSNAHALESHPRHVDWVGQRYWLYQFGPFSLLTFHCLKHGKNFASDKLLLVLRPLHIPSGEIGCETERQQGKTGAPTPNK